MGPVVQEPSRYRLFVFVLSRELLSTTMQGELDVRVVKQEVICGGHQCGEVTTGLYLAPEEVQNTSFLVEQLAKGLGLEPPFPLLPDPPEKRYQRPATPTRTP